MSDATRIGARDADQFALPAPATLAPARAEREPLTRQARTTDAGRQLMRCFPRRSCAPGG